MCGEITALRLRSAGLGGKPESAPVNQIWYGWGLCEPWQMSVSRRTLLCVLPLLRRKIALAGDV